MIKFRFQPRGRSSGSPPPLTCAIVLNLSKFIEIPIKICWFVDNSSNTIEIKLANIFCTYYDSVGITQSININIFIVGLLLCEKRSNVFIEQHDLFVYSRIFTSQERCTANGTIKFYIVKNIAVKCDFP